jgi:probable F420-dependent oxidoreductase
LPQGRPVGTAPAEQVAEAYHRIEDKRDRSARVPTRTGYPQHTRRSSKYIGPESVPGARTQVVLARDAEASGKIGRETVDFTLDLSNYLNNWKWLGFTDDDVAKPGSDRLIDSLVAHGTPDDIAKRLNEHIEAGADHLAIQVLGGWGAGTSCCRRWKNWRARSV